MSASEKTQTASFSCLCEREPGHVGVVPDPGVAQHVGGPLGHQNFDLVHWAAELQVAQVEAGGEAVGTAPLVRQDVLQGQEEAKEKNKTKKDELESFETLAIISKLIL